MALIFSVLTKIVGSTSPSRVARFALNQSFSQTKTKKAQGSNALSKTAGKNIAKSFAPTLTAKLNYFGKMPITEKDRS